VRHGCLSLWESGPGQRQASMSPSTGGTSPGRGWLLRGQCRLAGSGACTDPAVLSAAAAQAERLLNVAGAEPVKRALRVAVAELHIEAGDAYLQATL
jgi:hypothetical protein